MSMALKFGIVVFLTLVSTHSTYSASLDAESTSEQVTIKLYRFDTSMWSGKESAFKAVVVTQANMYCSTSPSSCGLAEWLPTAVFGNTSVSVSTSADLKDLEVSFWIAFPTGANVSSASSTQFVVNNVAAKAIITNIRVDVEHTVGTYLTYIEEDFYGIPPDNVANQVIIPIAFVVLFTVIVVAIALHIWNKRKMRQRRKHHDMSSSKVSPSHINQDSVGKNIETQHNLKGSNVNNATKEAYHMEKVTTPSTTLSHTPRTNNEFIEVNETHPNNLPPHHLPSLPAEDAEGDQRRDRKHKKKKKKKHRRQNCEDTGNGHSDSENTRKHSQEHYNRALEDVDDNDSDYYK